MAALAVVMAGAFPGASEVEANGRRSQKEGVCPGIFAIAQSRSFEFAPDASCVTIGNAATQPVRLNETKAMRGRRQVMGTDPFRNSGSSLADCPQY